MWQREVEMQRERQQAPSCLVFLFVVFQFLSRVQLCDLMDCSMPDFPVLYHLPEFAQIHVHWVSDAIQPSHPLSSPSRPAFIFSSIRVFPNESTLHIRWPKYWSFSFSISPSNEYSGLISFRIDWFDLLAVQRALKSLLQHHGLKASAFFMAQLSLAGRAWDNSWPTLDTCRFMSPLSQSHSSHQPCPSCSAACPSHSRTAGQSPLPQFTWWSLDIAPELAEQPDNSSAAASLAISWSRPTERSPGPTGQSTMRDGGEGHREWVAAHTPHNSLFAEPHVSPPQRRLASLH